MCFQQGNIYISNKKNITFNCTPLEVTLILIPVDRRPKRSELRLIRLSKDCPWYQNLISIEIRASFKSAESLLDYCMSCTLKQVDCKSLRTTYEGRWDAMVSKCAKCVLKLLELAHRRRRNFILDQVRITPILLLDTHGLFQTYFDPQSEKDYSKIT